MSQTANLPRTRNAAVALLLMLAMVFAAGVGLARTSPASALTNCTVSDFSLDTTEQQFLTLINSYRAQNGRGALTVSTNLNRAAHWMGNDLGVNRYFSHTDSLGRSPSQRALDCDYPAGAGENLAAGTNWTTAQAAFDAWRNSSGHNANMLNANYRQIGIARVFVSGSQYGYYWVTKFGTVNDGTSGGGSGGGTTATATPTRTATVAATATPTRTPTPAAASQPANISSPSAGSTLPGASTSFTWNAAPGALEYFFYAGTSQGSNNITGRSMGSSTSVSVTNLPTNGSTVHVRLWTRFSTGWQYRDTTYTAASPAAATPTPVATTSAKATLTTPTNGSTFGGTSTQFQWTAGTGALQYFFYLGTTQGSNNLVGASMGLNRSVTINNLPGGGQTVHVRLWTRFSNGWQYNDYSFRTAP